MAIMVQYNNRSFGYVAYRELDEMIDKGVIIAFRRESGWAEIGRDPIRQASVPQAFEGPDRRAATGKRSCLTCVHFVDSACRSVDCTARTSSQAKEVERSVLS